MALLFLDSSALVKRCVTEAGSAWLRGLTSPAAGHRLYVAAVTGPELVAAGYYVLDVGPAVVSRAMDLAETRGLRGYDAVQLAAALGLRDANRLVGLADPLLIASDADLNAAAQAEGLAVDDSNSHP